MSSCAISSQFQQQEFTETCSVAALLDDSADLPVAVHHQDDIGTRQNIEMMRDKYAGSRRHGTRQDAVREQVMADMGVHCTQGIVE